MLRNQSGNVFFAIFGAVALVGVLTAGVSTFVKGPLATSVKITRQNTAENQMSIAGQVAVMAAANTPSGGDCDGDTFVEPIEWREDITKPFPVGGGLIPSTIVISKKDPWGTEYGYCVWDHGSATNGAGSCGGSTQKRLSGTNSKAYPVVALVSAGPDKTFTTTCRSFADADVDNDGLLETAGVDLAMVGKASSSDDDVIFTYSYEEATGASGGLWSLKSGDPGTAVINKKIESSGVGSFAGGVLLPDSSLITCDPTTAGIMAKNASGNGISICDGTDWQEISAGGSAGGSGLVLTPNVSSGMNINGTCGTATCYSTDVVFRLKNNLSPAAASSPIAVALSNTLNFMKVSDNCNGISLPAGNECQIVVRARASGNISYAGELTITANNSPRAMLDGVASSFPGCNAGGSAPGGFYLACGIGGYDLVVTPSGCTGGMTNPTCAGGADTMTAPGMSGSHIHAAGCCTSTNGQQNTANVIAYSQNGVTSYPAASYCDGLTYQGFTDWFLPSTSEMVSYFYPNRVAVGWTNSAYFTSNEQTNYAGYWGYMTAAGAANSTSSPGNPLYVRCMRWTPAKAVTPMVDTTPADVVFNPSYGGAAQTRTSNTVTIYGITQAVNVTISGGTAAKYSVNGGAYTSGTSSVSNGAQITLQATSPVAGQESVVTVNIGSSSYNWQVRTPGNNTIRVFTTSTTFTGALGGAGGADASCTARANSVGLPGAWVAVVGTGSGFSLPTRLPWNWVSLKNFNGVGTTVATSLNDFLDGTISAPMNFSESGGVVSSNIWTGLYWDGSTYGNCANWTIASSSGNNFGDSSAVTAGAYLYTNQANCGNSYRLLCMESNAAGADLDPDTVNIGPAVVYAAGATGLSRAVTLTGITDEITVTITPSSGTANIIKNGVPVGAATTTAGLNETLSFSLTAPTVLGTKNTATISLGPDNYNWWVGYADSAKTARAFVAYKSGGNHGGLSGADSVCNAAAATSTLGLSSSWKAILSDSTTHAAERIPWNWGTLKTVTGSTIVDSGYVDLMDGTIDSSMGFDQNGNAVNNNVWTGSNRYGLSLSYAGTGPSGWCYNWTNDSNYGGGMATGFSSSIGTSWLENGSSWCGNDSAYGKYIYCLENVDDVSDTVPNSFTLDYAIQVPVSSRQTSAPVIISGMSTGVSQTMSVTATGGTPRMKINGGAEVSSGTIANGDSVVFLMDAPATGNSNNKMTITASTMSVVWRVWTGDTTGTAVKRVFVSSNTHQPKSFGGVAGADSRCQARATALALGGTWKAMISGIAENDWAINRIGYNWSELKLVDGSTTVAYAGGLWNGSSLLSPIIKNESGTVQSGSTTMTNTTQKGFAATTVSGSQNCGNWTTYYPYVTFLVGNTAQSSSPQWIYASQYCDPGCDCSYNLYCIEQ